MAAAILTQPLESPHKRFRKRGVWAAVICILAILAGIFASAEVMHKLERTEQSLSVIAGVAAAAGEKALVQPSPSELQRLLNNLKEQSDIAGAAFFDSRGNLISVFNASLASHNSPFNSANKRLDALQTRPVRNRAIVPPVLSWLKNSFSDRIQRPITREFAEAVSYNGRSMHLLRPVIKDDELVGGVYLLASMTPGSLFISAFCGYAAFFLVLALSLLGFSSLFFRQKLFLSLKHFTNSLAKISQDESVSLPLLFKDDPHFAPLAELCHELIKDNRHLREKLNHLVHHSSLQSSLAQEDLSGLRVKHEELHAALEQTRARKEEAEQANKIKADFLANMSHELRTPLTAVIGMADFLWQSELKPDQRRSVEVMKHTTSMLLSIIDDILDFAKIESGDLSLNTSEFNCHELLSDTFQLLALDAKAKDLKYTLEIAAEFPCLLIGDSNRINQVLVNLLSNAIKFTAQGEVKLRVSATPVENRKLRLLCEVTDTGIGITKDKMDLIFSTFKQNGSAIDRVFPGTGLGLAISKQLIQLMEGQIGVNSQPGIGSTFWFWLDLPTSETPVKAIKPLNNYRFNAQLLVAEDYPANQMVAQRFLEDLGCDVEMVSNGFEAVKAVKNRHFDLVFMDCQMPFMDGYQATKEIRRHQLANGIDTPLPIIALTAHALHEDETRCKDAGMDEWVTKPFTRHDLSKTLQKWLPKNLILSGQPTLKTDVGTLAKASSILDETSAVNIKFLTQQFKLDNIDDLAFLNTLTQAFQQSAAQTLSNLQESIDDRNADNIRKLAHGLKSISTNVGSGKLADLCALMEQAGQNNAFEGLQELLDSMKQEYLRVLMELNSLCAKV